MKPFKAWLNKFLSFPRGKTLDPIDESLDESFPASDPPAWAGWKNKKSTSPETKMADPLAILKEEHRALMQITYLMHEQIERLQQNHPPQPDALKRIHEFLCQFVEKTHYQKEETLLLKALEESGAPLSDCPLALLQEDRALSLVLIGKLEKLLPDCEKNEKGVRATLMATLDQLKDIYARHTLREENYIFPLVEKYLSQSKQKLLSQAFNKLDS